MKSYLLIFFIYICGTKHVIIFIGDTISHTKDTGEPVPMQVESEEQSKNDSADVTLEQMDTQKDVTDEDVMHHLDVIENIELDPETFCMDKSMENANQSEASKSEEDELIELDEITVIEEVRGVIEEDWYKKKVLRFITFILSSSIV